MREKSSALKPSKVPSSSLVESGKLGESPPSGAGCFSCFSDVMQSLPSTPIAPCSRKLSEFACSRLFVGVAEAEDCQKASKSDTRSTLLQIRISKSARHDVARPGRRREIRSLLRQSACGGWNKDRIIEWDPPTPSSLAALRRDKRLPSSRGFDVTGRRDRE